MLFKLKHFAVTLAALLACAVLSAQNARQTIVVTGTVVDEVGPVGGATVTVKGHPELGGKVTGPNGGFTFNISPGMTLQISCIGYKTAEKAFNKAADWYVVLEDDAIMLGEVITVGYGVQKKESVVGSISQVGSEALINSGTTNITNALAGKLAGVMTYQSSGQPGNNDATIFIRGKSTWQNTNPLILVDGIEREMDDVDFNEIESVSVLKDASATAVYGVRGGNGVILLTTKRGTSERPTVKFSASVGFKQPTSRNNWADYVTSMQAWNEAYANDGNYDTNVLFPQSTIDAWRNAIATGNTGPYNDTFPSVIWEDEDRKSVV